MPVACCNRYRTQVLPEPGNEAKATTGPGAAFSPTGLHHLILLPDRILLGANFWPISTTPARFLGRTGISLIGRSSDGSEVSEDLSDVDLSEAVKKDQFCVSFSIVLGSFVVLNLIGIFHT
jgi:hypothetical protein